MDIRTKFTINIPEALIEALGITEDTLFIVGYESGELTIEPLIDSESNDFYYDEQNKNEWFEGYDEDDICDKDIKNYSCDSDETHNKNRCKEKILTDCGIDCDYVCGKCRFRNMNEKACNEDKE